MPELQPNEPAGAGVPPALLMAAVPETDFDYALGCECADPALQIDWWRDETSPPPAQLG
ncbi:hypothetical protein HHL11_14435 [Ramlibacter sp. G-1-2-2]|uniref:Uncharacterized protein n=1 Tax=Ramlibacter agri TaxID=2728837 RepID=A0A848H8U3_9BURK|nr:hypothetical protein [Ramlibacter agri]NML44953.1 hypothetical protein [Ramlibacter agri]